MTTDRQWQIEIHERLVARDPPASEELCDCLLERLKSYTIRKAPYYLRYDKDSLADIAIDVLLKYIAEPTQFDPSRGKSLLGYLRMAIDRDLLNAAKSEQRRSRLLVPIRPVEDGDDDRNIDLKDPAAEQEFHVILDHETDEACWRWARQVVTDPVERKVLALMADGERRTEVFAEAMGIQHLPLLDQRRQVKQVKDRIQKRLQRAYDRKME